MKHLLFILTFIFLSLGCNSHGELKSEKAIVIQLAIDASLKLDSGLNTDEFWIDFSKTNYFDKTAVNEFLKANRNFKRVNGDSLLYSDSTWTRYGYLNKMLINFRKVEIKGDSIIIELDKIKASDGSNGIEVIIKKESNKLKVLSSKITWIS